jgi:multiple sugar transport system substrate-binding protein
VQRWNRRKFLSAAGAASLLGATASAANRATAAQLRYQPERGAKLRVLRWKRFVQGDEDQWMRNTRRFSESTGIEVRVDSENWEEVRPKAAVAANIGAGPDIVIGTNEEPHQYPDKLLDVTDLAEYLGAKYGGWFEASRQFGMHEGRWVAIPTGAAGAAMVYRKSMLQAVGYESVPQDFPGFLKLCAALKSKGTPCAMALGHATGDANAWAHWVLWGFGARLVDERNAVAINSRETFAALEYATELYGTFPPGTAAWLDPNNNKAFLAGEIALTLNGISIYYSARASAEPAMKAIAPDIGHAYYPVGPSGDRATAGTMFPAFIFRYSRYPNAAREYLRYMMEKEQYEPWQAACIGYVSHPLRAYESNPVWRSDPHHGYFRDTVKTMRHYGYAGTLGRDSAAAVADFVVVDMFAEVCTGSQSPRAAAQRAERRARRHYKI